MKNICVLRLSALGDCCHALSVIQILQRQFPESSLSWVINKNDYQLFRDIPNVDCIIVDKENLVKSFSQIFFAKKKKIFTKKEIFKINPSLLWKLKVVRSVIRFL